jgi:sugar/nucleoside kinase (ribokinase family)
MSDLLVVGSVALDTLQTPFGQQDDILGGSATFFSFSASNLVPVRLVGVVGNDFPGEHVQLFKEHRIDTDGLEHADGLTFRWNGYYEGDMSQAITKSVDLNVFADFQPKVPEEWTDTKFVFLANGSPTTQLSVLDQVKSPEFVMADTMNLWIENTPDDLKKVIARVDAMVMNDQEALMLTDTHNLITAARKILSWGPKYVVIKKGHHGAFLASEEGFFAMPAYPLEEVHDPTGAGDSFAGGMMGYIAKTGVANFANLKKSMGYGTILASFAVASLGTDSIRQATPEEMEARLNVLHKMLSLD